MAPKSVTIDRGIKSVTRGVPGPPGDLTQPFTSITFDTVNPDDPITDGQVAWDKEDVTLQVKQNGTTLQIGQEQQWPVVNKTGSIILNGTPVMANGTTGATGRIHITPMDGTDTANAKLFLGLTSEDIADQANGKVTTFGKVRDIQTNGGQYGETWIDGEIIYISPTTIEALTNTEPTAGQLKIPCAFVINANPTSGVLAARVTPIDENLLNDMLSIGGQAWDVNTLGSVTTTLIMDASLNSEFTATLPLTGTTTTISITNLPTEKNGWPVLHLITGATFDAPVWSGIDATGITLVASTTHNIGFQPVKTTSAWKIVAVLMHSEADA